eukprot:g31360.t1
MGEREDREGPMRTAEGRENGGGCGQRVIMGVRGKGSGVDFKALGPSIHDSNCLRSMATLSQSGRNITVISQSRMQPPFLATREG